ncbi:hypothetical protein CR513_08662, partial [Mucuna pruriens]
MVKLIFQGDPFSWRRGSLQERLDRLLCNLQWRFQYPEATIHHLPYFNFGDKNTKYVKEELEMTRSHQPSLIGVFPRLNQDDFSAIGSMVSDDEICKALFSMDGFKIWRIVGPSMCRMIFENFQDPTKVEMINDTLISLIPKVEPVCSIKYLCPISRCNVSYKDFLSQRIKGVTEKLVSPYQSSYVPNRSTNDNMTIVQEVIHSMKYKKGDGGWMTIKDFVIETIQDIGFPPFINLVWYYISSSRMKVLWKGRSSNFLSWSV